MDVAAVDHAKKLLKKTKTIFQHLDHENSLVLSCWKYIHQLSIMCSFRGELWSTYASDWNARRLTDASQKRLIPSKIMVGEIMLCQHGRMLLITLKWQIHSRLYHLTQATSKSTSCLHQRCLAIFENNTYGAATWDGMMI